MRETTSDIGIQVEFTLPLQAIIPLSREDRLGRKDFPIPIAIFYGSIDWVMAVDGLASQKIIDNSEKNKLYMIPDSDHNMHMDNPQGLVNSIFNEVFGDDLPVLKHHEYSEYIQPDKFEEN